MIATIIVSLLVFTLASVTSVYAQTVDVPFDSEKFDSETENCVTYTNMKGEVKYLCEWDPFEETEVVIEDITEEVVTDEAIEKLMCPDGFQILNDQCLRIEEAERRIALQEEIDEVLKNFIIDLDRLSDKDNKTVAETEYYAELQYLATCQRGMSEAFGIQQQDRYAISTTWVNNAEAWLKAFELTGRHADLNKAIQECIWQHTVLEPVILGPQYLNRANAQAIEQNPYHALRDSVVDIRPYKNSPLTDTDFDRTNNVAKATLCDIVSTAKLDYCLEKSGIVTGGAVNYDSAPYHRYQIYLDGEQHVNTSIRSTSTNEGPIGNFIAQHGGYEGAIDAIKWKKHFDANTIEEMSKDWRE